MILGWFECLEFKHAQGKGSYGRRHQGYSSILKYRVCLLYLYCPWPCPLKDFRANAWQYHALDEHTNSNGENSTGLPGQSSIARSSFVATPGFWLF